MNLLIKMLIPKSESFCWVGVTEVVDVGADNNVDSEIALKLHKNDLVTHFEVMFHCDLGPWRHQN